MCLIATADGWKQLSGFVPTPPEPEPRKPAPRAEPEPFYHSEPAEGDVITFANKSVGCVTRFGRLVLVSPQGFVRRARDLGPGKFPSQSALPIAAAYCAKHAAVAVEHAQGRLDV